MSSLRLNGCAVGALVLFFCADDSRGQVPERSGSELVGVLTDQSERPGRSSMDMVRPSCGWNIDDLSATKSLLRLGRSAIPVIENAFDSKVNSGVGSDSIYINPLLLYVYAEVNGPTAFPRLQKLADNVKLRFVHDAIDASIAMSLGLTSWIDDHRVPSSPLCRVPEPRDSLDQLISAWARNDQQQFEASLGPVALAALKGLLHKETWPDLRARLQFKKFGAMGYRFAIRGPWSEAAESFNDGVTNRRSSVDLSEIPPSPEIETAFSDSAGRVCGRLQVKFSQYSDGPGARVSYLVNNADLSSILRTVASCSSIPN